MGPGSDARIPQFSAFDKAEPWWRARPEPKMADERPKPLLRRGIWTNCLPLGHTSPAVWQELVTGRFWVWTYGRYGVRHMWRRSYVAAFKSSSGIVATLAPAFRSLTPGALPFVKSTPADSSLALFTLLLAVLPRTFHQRHSA